MLIKKQVLQGIAEGRIGLAYRRWKRPTVKPGGELRTAIGVLAIDSVDIVDLNKISAKDAKQAGYASPEGLREELEARTEGEIYRIALRYLGDDPRLALREQCDLTKQEMEEIQNRLKKMDARSRTPWIATTLDLIAANPAKRAPDLADSIGMETKRFKANVRKLKELGLTESLKVGYRLSPRGKVVYAALK